MSDEDFEILSHALGMTIENYRKSLKWWLDDDKHRNHYCLPAESTKCIHLVFRGMMSVGDRVGTRYPMIYYHVTPKAVPLVRQIFHHKLKSGEIEE